MNKLHAKSVGAAIVAVGMLASVNVYAGSLLPNSDSFETSVQRQLNQLPSQQNFLMYKLILDLGARANGTKKNAAGDHAAWCAKIHKSYDPASNTFTTFNGKSYTCRSPYQ